MKFKLIENLDLEEDILNEETYYRVDFNYNNSGTTKKDYVYVVTKKNATQQDIEQILKNGVPHETSSKKWTDDVFSNPASGYKIISFSETSKQNVIKNKDHVFTLTYSPQRRKSRNAANKNKNFKKRVKKVSAKNNINGYDYIIHHPEGNESSFDPRINSFILYKGSKHYANIVHQLMELTKLDPRILSASAKCEPPIVVYDQKSGRFVARRIKVMIVKDK